MYLETHYIHKHFVVMAEITMTTDCKKFSNFVSDKAVSPLRCYNATSATSQSNSAIKATSIRFFFENIESSLFPKKFNNRQWKYERGQFYQRVDH